jgi:hypothetical protein
MQATLGLRLSLLLVAMDACPLLCFDGFMMHPKHLTAWCFPLLGLSERNLSIWKCCQETKLTEEKLTKECACVDNYEVSRSTACHPSS